jgi:hypothetical protein
LWTTGRPVQSEAELRGPGDPSEAGRRLPRHHRVPLRPGSQPHQPRRRAEGDGPSGRGGGRTARGPGGPSEAGRREPHRTRLPPQPGGQP